ncbi:MAG: GAF domain-containing protein, partial [Anaerolineae bacterium]
MVNLLTLTSIVNFLALTISLWLGFYLVTRSPRRRVSWLAALTLWSITCLFFNNLLHLNIAPDETFPLWLTSFRGTVIPAPAFWFHLTILFLPPKVWKWQRHLVAAAYLAAAFLLIIGGATNQLLPGVTEAGRELASSRQAGALYPYFVGFTLITLALALGNLTYGWLHARGEPGASRQSAILWAATLLGSAGAAYLTISIWQSLPIPTLPGEFSLGAGVCLLGYAVAKYDALIEGRVMRTDFLYSLLSTAVVTTFFLIFTSALYLHYHLPFAVIILVTVLAIISHSLYDGVRSFLDRLFYGRRYQVLRTNLRVLAQEAGTYRELPDQLQAILAALCRSLGAPKGLIAIKEGETLRVEAALPLKLRGRTLKPLPAEEVTPLTSQMADELLGMGLLVPLHRGGEEIGALLLGERATGAYSPEELDMLDDLSVQMGAIIQERRLQEESIQQIEALVNDFRDRERELQRRLQAFLAQRRPPEILEGITEKEFVALVEDGLRRLFDYSYLGEHKLAHLSMVERQLQSREAPLTHLDRGKALKEVLLQALDKLRPPASQPDPPTLEWYPFLVLHDAYVLGEPNRDIMSKLYISEGTFNRTRRRAVRALAKALLEMEQ